MIITIKKVVLIVSAPFFPNPYCDYNRDRKLENTFHLSLCSSSNFRFVVTGGNLFHHFVRNLVSFRPGGPSYL